MSKVRVLVAVCSFWLALAHAQQQSAAEQDQQLSTRVMEALVQQGIASDDIDVDSHEGVVQLTGFVPSNDHKEQAGLTASNVKGVAYVQNGLIVRGSSTGPEKRSDAVIAETVREHLIREVGPDGAANITVQVQDGIVQLGGFVASVEHRNRAAALARNIDGVREVRDSLSVTR